MTDKEYIKGLLEETNICNQIISKYEELTNDYKHEIERLNNEYNKAFERLKSQQREIDRLKEENDFLNRTDEDRCKEAESTIRASIANAGTSCRWCEDTIRKNAVKEFAESIIKELWDIGIDSNGKQFKCGDLTSKDVWRIAKQFGVEVEE